MSVFFEKTENDVYIIAEVGVNHNGDKTSALKLMDMAKKAGADAVKFQMYYPKLLCSGLYRKDELEMLEKYFTPIEFMDTYKAYAEKINIDFIVTPFDFRSLDEICKIGVSIIKIGSGELTHTPFLEKAAQMTTEAIILSTGAADMTDVRRAAAVIRKNTARPAALLHCVSCYPAEDTDLNLRAITTLRDAFPDFIAGYSDHSLGVEAGVCAAALGAKIIERHITLDKKLPGPDHKASADPEEFFKSVIAIRRAAKMTGDGIKRRTASEGVIGRSMVYARDLKKGDSLSKSDIDFKRPGDGIRPYKIDKFIGEKLITDVKCDQKLEFGHFDMKTL